MQATYKTLQWSLQLAYIYLLLCIQKLLQGCKLSSFIKILGSTSYSTIPIKASQSSSFNPSKILKYLRSSSSLVLLALLSSLTPFYYLFIKGNYYNKGALFIQSFLLSLLDCLPIIIIILVVLGPLVIAVLIYQVPFRTFLNSLYSYQQLYKRCLIFLQLQHLQVFILMFFLSTTLISIGPKQVPYKVLCCFFSQLVVNLGVLSCLLT